ncbi:MAG TPA: DUF4232 domain-containing protein [Trebonia sp.]|jgi:hypothetical protein|nr:DUF4232 domain-containing protein [Trebonia sp.]
MRAGARGGWRLVTAVAFGATATLAVFLSRGAPPADTTLASASGSAAGSQIASAAGSATGQAAGRPAGTGSPVTAVVPACAASGLRVSVGPGSRLAAGVTRYAVQFTNISGTPCALGGYPQVAAYRGDGVQVGANALRDTSAAASRVLLAPGQTAHASLDAVRPLPRCRPVRASGLRVIVSPGQPAVRYVRPMTACTAPGASGQGYLHVRAIQAGTGIA